MRRNVLPDRQIQRLALLIDSNRRTGIRPAVSAHPYLTAVQMDALPPDSPLRSREFCVRWRLRWTQCRRQLVIKPKEVGVLPHMANHMLRDGRFNTSGEIARQPGSPARR